jgi:hypothetical protein
MAHERGLGEGYLLFGAYPGGRGEEAPSRLRHAVYPGEGALLPAAEAYRAWGERFHPVSPSRPAPEVRRSFVPLAGLEGALAREEERALQGTISRSGEVLLLALDGAARALKAP